MASLFSHAVAALGIGACFYKVGIPKRVWVVGAACSPEMVATRRETYVLVWL